MLTWAPEQRNRFLFRVTGHPEVMPGGPEVGFGEVRCCQISERCHLREVRFWIASGLPTIRE
jgi:hypothetical protein